MKIVSTEDLILKLSPKLKNITPHLQADSPVIQAEVSQTISAEAPEITSSALAASITWPTIQVTEKMNLPPWPPLKALTASWESGKFGVLKGTLEEEHTFLMQTVFNGKGTLQNGKTFGVKSHQEIRWKNTDGNWTIDQWHQRDFKLYQGQSQLFSDVTSQAIPDTSTAENLEKSALTDSILNFVEFQTFTTPKLEYQDLPDIASNNQFPSISVVDIDNDGWDDLFITGRYLPATLLHNQKDGSYTDVTESYGLSDYLHIVNAIFTDFDNDGDQDLFLARTLEPCAYLINENGRFKPATQSHTNLGSQFLASSASVADINRDGLPDLYLCTYNPIGKINPIWQKRYLSNNLRPKVNAAVIQSIQAGGRYTNLRGMPNLILMNRGNGKLEVSKARGYHHQWRQTYQATFADFDNDGDDDLYVANDFAPDALLINETPAGANEPVFKAGRDQHFPKGLMAYGMGASWGDYDRDGDLDLYVSNMYSKAGTRILAQSNTKDPRLLASAYGNHLFTNNRGKFQQSAGKAKNQHAVHQVGWAYGGQFADFDNNGELDIYAPTGYYTAPSRVASQVDL